MPSGPQRRATRAPHLSAAAVPVELALIARAEELESGPVLSLNGTPAATASEVRRMIAAEFRSLAEEMHWWA